MKTRIHTIFFSALMALGFIACEDEAVREVLEIGDAPSLTVDESTLVFTRENAQEEAATFSWTPADYGYNAAVRYTLQFDFEGNNFAAPSSINLQNKLDSTLTVERMNIAMLQLGVEPETATDLEARLVAEVLDPAGASPQVEPLISNTVSLNVTPYSNASYLYVPGEYQSWNPGSAPVLTSEQSNGIYEGIIHFPADAANFQFKITAQRNWDGPNYGNGGEGVLTDDGGAGNLSVPGPGTYRITANLNDMSWEAVPYSWGVIGSATSGGWEADQDMMYDYDEGIWTATLDLVPGEIKFRLNDTWDVNYGLDGDGNFVRGGGTNIPVTEAGTYEITFDLRDEDAPAYTLVKQ